MSIKRTIMVTIGALTLTAAAALPAHAATIFDGDMKNSVNSNHKLRVYYRADDTTCSGASVVLDVGETAHGTVGSVRSSVAAFELQTWAGVHLENAPAGGCINVAKLGAGFDKLKVVVD